jgi:hypothetical protein
MRLRIAFHNQCRTYMSVGYVDEGDNLVFARDTSEASDHMGRTTLRFVDLFASNPVAIDDKFTTGWGNTSMKESWSRSARLRRSSSGSAVYRRLGTLLMILQRHLAPATVG